MSFELGLNEIRQILRREFGDRKYRITRHGEINVYGIMPNSDQKGWYFLGYINDPEVLELIQELDQHYLITKE